MPKRINGSNPVAAIRNLLEMKITEFAEFIGHGESMLKHVEAGRKPLGKGLADKLHTKTGVSYDILFKTRVNDDDRVIIAKAITRADRPIADLPVTLAVLILASQTAAICVLLAGLGKDPGLALRPIKREIARLLKAWKLSEDESKLLFEEWRSAIFAPQSDAPAGTNALSALVLGLQKSKSYDVLEAARAKWSKKNPPSDEFMKEMAPIMELEKARNRPRML